MTKGKKRRKKDTKKRRTEQLVIQNTAHQSKGKGKGKGRERGRERQGKGKGKGRERGGEGRGRWLSYRNFLGFNPIVTSGKKTHRATEHSVGNSYRMGSFL